MTKKLKPALFYLLLAACAAMILFARLCPGLQGAEALCAVAILVFAILSWMFELAPVSVTALLVIAIIPLSGLMTFSETIAKSFGNSIFAFFLGVLLLSVAFQKTNLGRLIALGLFRIFGRRPRALVLGIMAAGAFLAMWVTEVASAAILFPIALSIVDQTKDRPDHAALGRTLMLSVAWGPAFGGVATPIATGANLIAVNYLEEYAHLSISFFQWMKIGVPICLTLLVAGWLLLSRGIQDNSELEVDTTLPACGRREYTLAVVFLLAVLLWIFGGKLGLSSHHVALLAGCALFLPGLEVLGWKEAVGRISWDSIILICAGVVMGELLYQYGVAQWMANVFFVPALLRSGLFTAGIYIVLSVAVLKVLFSSNTVTGIVLVPIMILLAQGLGLSPWMLVAPCIFSSALSFLVITSSPVNVIPYGAGYFTPVDMLKYGSAMTLLSAVIIAGWLAVLPIGAVPI